MGVLIDTFTSMVESDFTQGCVGVWVCVCMCVWRVLLKFKFPCGLTLMLQLPKLIPYENPSYPYYIRI